MRPYLSDPDVTLYHGDAGAVLATLPDASVDCVVTSPPYFGLRDYGYDGQIGLEDTPAAFVARLVDVFREVRRVLSPTGVCWVNMGDSYAHGGCGTSDRERWPKQQRNDHMATHAKKVDLAPKQLLGIPWRLAFGLQDDGWWLRSDVIWAKPNPMPESVTDRPTKAHEYLFLLTRSPRYYWDAEGVKEPVTGGAHARGNGVNPKAAENAAGAKQNASFSAAVSGLVSERNVRSVWTFPTEPNPEAHFATFPRELVRRCLAAGCPERVCATCGEPSVRVVESDAPGERINGTRPGRVVMRDGWIPQSAIPEGRSRSTVGWSDCGHDNWRPGVALDPFIGSGTTAVVARAMGRRTVGIDGSEEYLAIARRRTQQLSLLGEAV